MKKTTLLFAAVIGSLSAFAQTVQRIPLFEIFTSSTCPPCKQGNENFNNVVNGKPKTEYVAIKYQQNFPGTGDPYTTAETVSRRTTPYAINSIPRMETDGGWDGNASSFTSAMYTAARAVAPLYDITGTYFVDQATKMVTAKVKFRSLGTVTNPKLYVGIIENLTTKNKKSNGETQFENVMKKMMPSQTGTALTANTSWDSLSFSFQFKGNYRLPADGQAANYIKDATEHSVEGFDDIRVVAWIQGSDKKVYQAFNLILSATTGIENMDMSVKNIVAYPSPATDMVNVSFTSEKQDKVQFLLTSVDGSISQTFDHNVNAGSNVIGINTSKFASGTYFLSVIDSKSNAFSAPVVIVK